MDRCAREGIPRRVHALCCGGGDGGRNVGTARHRRTCGDAQACRSHDSHGCTLHHGAAAPVSGQLQSLSRGFVRRVPPLRETPLSTRRGRPCLRLPRLHLHPLPPTQVFHTPVPTRKAKNPHIAASVQAIAPRIGSSQGNHGDPLPTVATQDAKAGGVMPDRYTIRRTPFRSMTINTHSAARQPNPKCLGVPPAQRRSTSRGTGGRIRTLRPCPASPAVRREILPLPLVTASTDRRAGGVVKLPLRKGSARRRHTIPCTLRAPSRACRHALRMKPPPRDE